MFYAVYVPPSLELPDGQTLELEQLIFNDVKEASTALKKYKGSRMKTFDNHDKALNFLRNPEPLDESFLEESGSESPANKSIGPGDEPSEFPSAKPDLLNRLRRQIEAGNYDEVDSIIWSNPRTLVTVCDSAVYMMAGPKFNACHIAARANKPDIMALILDTISNFNFLRKLYPREPDDNVQDRINHLLDSYLNTPDPRQGNTPLHFACKLGHYWVVRVLLTFEGCDLTLKDSAGRTAEESICLQMAANQESSEPEATIKKIKNLFKCQLHLPLYKDQLKKRLLMAKRRNKVGSDSDVSFSDDSFTFSSPNRSKPA